jgi:hypothetical protein
MSYQTLGTPLASHGVQNGISAVHRYNDGGSAASGTTSGYDFGILGLPIVSGTYTPAVKGDIIVDSAASNVVKFYNGTSWVTLGSGGGGTTYWQQVGATTQIQPAGTFTDVVPRVSTADLGASSNPWDDIFLSDTLGFYISGTRYGEVELNTGSTRMSFNSFQNYSIDIDSDGRLDLDSDTGTYIDSDTTVSLTTSTSSGIVITSNILSDDTHIFDGDLEANSQCVEDIGDTDAFDRIYCDDLFENSCDIGELQWVAADYPPGTIVEMVAPNADLITFQGEEATARMEGKRTKPTAYAPDLPSGEPDFNTRDSEGRVLHFSKEPGPGIKVMWQTASPDCRNPRVITYTASHIMGASPLRRKAYRNNQMKVVALKGTVSNVFIQGPFNYNDKLVSAGEGFATVNNEAPYDQVLGYAAGTGADSASEVWLK